MDFNWKELVELANKIHRKTLEESQYVLIPNWWIDKPSKYRSIDEPFEISCEYEL